MQNRKTKEKNNSSPKSRKKKVLGRGIDALFPDMDLIDNKANDFFQCDIDIIRPNRYQPRRRFSEDELAELSQSIKEQGIIQPLLVRKNDVGYELVAGERRLRASKMAGFKKVPVMVRDITDTELLEISIVENIQREDLNPMEEAEAYKRLMIEFKLTQDQVAGRVGKSRPTVANFLRLCNLPKQIRDSLSEGIISMGHARALLGTETSAQQNTAFHLVISKNLSVRETEALIKKLKSEKKKKKTPPHDSDAVYFKSLEDDLSRSFGTKVQIKRKGQKGRVEIEFYSNDDLDRLFDLLRKK